MVAIFDNVEDVVTTVVTPVWPVQSSLPARAAYDSRLSALSDIVQEFDRSLPTTRSDADAMGDLPAPESNMSSAGSDEMVAAPRNTSWPATSSRWCCPQRFCCRSNCHPWRSIDRCAVSTRRPSCSISIFGGFR